MKRFLKSFAAVLLALAMVFPMVPTFGIAVTAASDQATGFVNFAKGKVGQSFTNGYSQLFVYRLVRDYFGADDSACCASQAWEKFGKSASRTDIPLGATVYFGGSTITCGVCGKKGGHVGIYVGDGNVVHAWDGTVSLTTIDWVVGRGYPYRGWGWNANYVIQQPIQDDQSEGWSEWSTVKPEEKDGRTIEEKTQYGYFHYVHTWKSGFKGAYPVKSCDRFSPKDPSNTVDYHEYWNDTELTKVTYWTDGYTKWDSFPNMCCNLGSNVSTLAYHLYDLNKTRKVYRYKDEPLKTYEITYDANGGLNAPDKQTKTHGEDITLALDVPTKEGHNFVGWSETRNGEKRYDSGDIYSDDESITLYAVWDSLTYTVRYDLNGGSGNIATQTKKYGNNLTLTSSKPTRDGYSFLGWSLVKNGPVKYLPDSIYADNNNVTLYAVWQEKEKLTFTVEYDANGGINAPAIQTKQEKIDITLSSAKPTRGGYNFKGWSIVRNGEVKYTHGDKYTKDENITLYAVWEPLTYTVTYKAEGFSTQTKTHDVAITLLTDEPAKEGYNFKGWSETSNGNVKYQPGDKYTENRNLTLYSIWEPLTYTVTYNANGGVGTISLQTKVHDVNLILTSSKPAKEGYTFIGWSEIKDGSVKYLSESIYADNRDVTLYAVWQEEDKEIFHVLYNANGGKNPPETQTKSAEEDILLSNGKPTRDGYIFNGWSTVLNGEVVYLPGDKYTKDESITLFAVWEPLTYKITYNANGGKNSPEEQVKKHDIPLTLSTKKPERDGFDFKGWARNKNASYAEFESGETFYVNKDTTLFAVWEESEEDEKDKVFPFIDVPEDAWFRKDVENAYFRGFVNGKNSPYTYLPNDNMTYAEAIKIACMIHQEYNEGKVSLVNGDDVWYSTFMKYATDNRIIRTDYSAIANRKITRRDFVVIFYGALPLIEFPAKNSISDDAIPDVKIGDAYFGEIYTFYRAGILTGSDEKGSFLPESNIKRSEVAAIVTRMVDKNARMSVDLK